MTTPHSPEEIARQQGVPYARDPDGSPSESHPGGMLPLMRALIDLDLKDPTMQVIGADPIDLTDIPVEPVRSLITDFAVITIVAHQGEGQEVANLLAARRDLPAFAIDYGRSYLEEGAMDFAFRALTGQEIENLERNTGTRLQRPQEDTP